MTSEAMMWIIVGGVTLMVGSPILWMFVKRELIKRGWRPKLSKLDELALNRDLRGYWERGLASKCITGVLYMSVFAGLLIFSALRDAMDFRQPFILMTGLLGICSLGSTIRQLMLGWDRVSRSRSGKQIGYWLELHREGLIHRFGEEIAQ